MKNKYNTLIKITGLFLFVLSTAHATVWYVHPDSTLNSIIVALSSCSDDDTVLVAAGTYNENIRWPNTQGIDLVSESGPDTTIIDGRGLSYVFLITQPVDSTTIISGFTIQNGYYVGGGIHCFGGSLLITNNVIADNRADFVGGGIYCVQASPIIRNNTITRNIAGIWGGGICCRDGSAPTIVNNTIRGNTADMTGGGIFCDNSSPTIFGNTISLNVATQTGGGITCWRSSANIIYNTITRNIAGNHGGGIYCWLSSPNIDSCTISSNNSDGVYCESSSNPVINYNDIVDNTGYGVLNVDSTVLINAEYNWWGDSTGPGGVGPGTGDEVSDYVDYDPWLIEPGLEENTITPVKHINIGATIFSGPLVLPKDKNCKVFDISGRVVAPDRMKPGIYFIEIDGEITQKVVKVR